MLAWRSPPCSPPRGGDDSLWAASRRTLSLSHPGGKITGLASFVQGQVVGKTIETLRQMVPTASKIAILVVYPGNPIHRLMVAEELPQIVRKLGVALPIVEATTAEELDIAFASAAARQPDAIVVFGHALTVNNAPLVTALAAKHRLPRFIYSDYSPPMAD
jgi:putative tryptophan/tyrosine transport system substrate-binding protein